MFDPALEAARVDLQLSAVEVWWKCLELAGYLDVVDIDAYLSGLVDLSDFEHDVIAHALNETYFERGGDHPLAYFRP